MDLKIQFRNDFQEACYWLKQRNQCASGGFNNGKSYVLCQKAITLALTFPNYRSVIARQYFKDLKATTMQTFFKICPPEFILTHDNQAGITVLKNKSLFYWMHLDAFDEQSLRGLEINSAFIDQAEEMQEAIYIVLDARIGRWDKAEVPPHLLSAYPEWPTNKWGVHRVPNYMFLGCNPDSQFHFIYRWYHPDSVDLQSDHVMVQAPTDEELGDPETMARMKGRDESWVRKYFKGEWGISEAQIHYIDNSSILDPSECGPLLAEIQKKARLYRVLDHGEASPTACGWFAALNSWHIGYREYYMPNTVVSDHRRNIHDLSQFKNSRGQMEQEPYAGNFADPDIFKEHSQKDGGFWSIAKEYSTSAIKQPKLFWNPADNNEFATRNRINELLKLDPDVRHPITGLSPASRFYLIKRTRDYPNGIHNGISEIQSQRRKLLTTVNGKAIYSDDREENVKDHFYDVIRYYTAIHGTPREAAPREVPRKSFAWYNRLSKRQRQEVLAEI